MRNHAPTLPSAVLMEIREKRTYRVDGYDTFAEYCQERWGWNRIRSHQLIDAARVIGALTDGVHRGEQPLPQNERQARELAPLRDEPEALRKVWREVVEEMGDRVTAANVREAVRLFLALRAKSFPQILRAVYADMRR